MNSAVSPQVYTFHSFEALMKFMGAWNTGAWVRCQKGGVEIFIPGKNDPARTHHLEQFRQECEHL